MRIITRPRSAGGAPPQAFDASAFCAAFTARSMSVFVAFATTARTPPEEGSYTSNVLPSDAAALLPSMMRCSVMSAPNGEHRLAVVAPIDSCVDQGRPATGERGVDRPLELTAVRRAERVHAEAPRDRLPVYAAEGHAGGRQFP